MVTKIIHVNFFIIIVVFFFSLNNKHFFNDFLIEKLNFFFFTKIHESSVLFENESESVPIQVQHVCLWPMHYSKQIQ